MFFGDYPGHGSRWRGRSAEDRGDPGREARELIEAEVAQNVVPVVDADRRDLALLAASLGREDRSRFIALLARATVRGHHVDVQVGRSGRDYTLFVTITNGDAVVEDQTFPMPWPDEELLRWHLLRLWITALLQGLGRWKAQRPWITSR